jgi:hypothetical protein
VVPPTEPCAPRSAQPLKVSIRDSSWGKGGRCVWLTNCHPCSTETSRNSGALTYPEPPWATSTCCGRPLLYFYVNDIRHQGPRRLRRGSEAASLQGLWVRIPPRAWMFACCECCVLSGRGLCDGLITRPEESYRLVCLSVIMKPR